MDYTIWQWIIQSINKIEQYTKNIDIEKIGKEELILDGCLMQLINIGELMNKITKKYKDFELKGIDLKRVVGLRNFIAHDYIGVNIGLVSRIIKLNIPELKKEIDEFLQK